jgi:hypothetical protein
MAGDDDGRPVFWALGASGASLSGPRLAFLVVRPAESEPLRIRRWGCLTGNKFTGDREEAGNYRGSKI